MEKPEKSFDKGRAKVFYKGRGWAPNRDPPKWFPDWAWIALKPMLSLPFWSFRGPILGPQTIRPL